MTLKDTINNAKEEALISLEHSVIYRHTDIEYVIEIAHVHSALCNQYYHLVKEEVEQMKKLYNKNLK